MSNEKIKIFLRVFLWILTIVIMIMIAVVLSIFLVLTLTGPVFIKWSAIFKNGISIWVICIASSILIFLFIYFSKMFSFIKKAFGIERISTGEKKKILFFQFVKKQSKITNIDFRPLIRRTLPFYGGLIAICILSSITVRTIVGFMTSKKIEELKTRGIPVSVREFHREIPKRKNAAQSLEKVLEKFMPSFPREYYSKISTLSKIENRWTERDREFVGKVMSSNAIILFINELEKILNEYELYQFVDYIEGAESPFSIKLPNFLLWRFAGRLLNVSAVHYLIEKNYELGWNYVRNIIKLAKLLSQDSTLVEKIISVELQEICSSAILRSMRNNPEICVSINRLLKLKDKNLVLDGCKSEFAWMLDRFRKCKKIKFNTFNISFEAIAEWGKEYSSKNILEVMLENLSEIAFKQTGALDLNFLWYINSAPDILFQEKSPLINKDELTRKMDLLPLWPLFFIKIWIPPVYVAYIIESSNDAMVQIVGLANAIRKYKETHGRYPAKIGELTRGFIPPGLLIDPFSRKNFIYKIEKEGFTIYSVGKNFKDDNGNFKDNADIGISMM